MRAEIEGLKPAVLHLVIALIEIGHVSRESGIGSIVKIQWKLQ